MEEVEGKIRSKFLGLIFVGFEAEDVGGKLMMRRLVGVAGCLH